MLLDLKDLQKIHKYLPVCACDDDDDEYCVSGSLKKFALYVTKWTKLAIYWKLFSEMEWIIIINYWIKYVLDLNTIPDYKILLLHFMYEFVLNNFGSDSKANERIDAQTE